MVIIVPPGPSRALSYSVLFGKKKKKQKKCRGWEGRKKEKEKAKSLLFPQLSQLHWHWIKLKSHCWQELTFLWLMSIFKNTVPEIYFKINLFPFSKIGNMVRLFHFMLKKKYVSFAYCDKGLNVLSWYLMD